jgi:hypothetical protein
MKTKEIRVYRIELSEWVRHVKIISLTDMEFAKEAARQGNIYSLQEFVEAFNNEETNEAGSYIRII